MLIQYHNGNNMTHFYLFGILIHKLPNRMLPPPPILIALCYNMHFFKTIFIYTSISFGILLKLTNFAIGYFSTLHIYLMEKNHSPNKCVR